MNLQALLDSLIPALGKAAVDKLAVELKELTAGVDAGWKRTILGLFTDAVVKFGPQGVGLAQTAIRDLLANKPPAINWADLEVASNILAELQNAEADRKSAVRDYATKLSEVLGTIVKGVLLGLL